LGKDLGFVVHGLAAVSLDGEVVSSTRIREAIREGQLDLAGQMLGRGYALGGRVVRGDQLGRQLGFPTANLDAAGLILPPAGVYAVHINTHFPLQLFSGSESLRGDARPLYRGVLNVGYRPTLAMATPQLRVEAHIFDFSGDLYGAELEITIVEKIRDEKRFPSLDDLKLQIAHDVASARNRFDQRSSP
jgi:riboflavin kinase/FMN adenylyltransferase